VIHTHTYVFYSHLQYNIFQKNVIMFYSTAYSIIKSQNLSIYFGSYALNLIKEKRQLSYCL